MQLDQDRLRRTRDDLALTQEALARKCEVSLKTIQRIERGEPVRTETAAAVAAALGLPLSELTAAAPEAGCQLTLRRVRSGKHLFDRLGRTDLGRIDCDVDATGANIELLTRLVTRLQGLMSEHWGETRRPASDLPLLERLRAIAELNDMLGELDGQGIGLFMGSYERYPVTLGEAGEPVASEPRPPLAITRVQISATDRDRLTSPIERAWDAAPAMGPGSDFLMPDEERLVVLYPTASLRAAAADAQGGAIEGDYEVVG